MFETCGKQIVDGVLHGFNGSIFAYGQTGSGKTYTMQGECMEDSANRGIMPRAIQHVFSQFQELSSHGWEYKCTCSFVEIYNETITDLLDKCVWALCRRPSSQSGSPPWPGVLAVDVCGVQVR